MGWDGEGEMDVGSQEARVEIQGNNGGGVQGGMGGVMEGQGQLQGHVTFTVT